MIDVDLAARSWSKNTVGSSVLRCTTAFTKLVFMPHLVNDNIDERQVFIFKASLHGDAYEKNEQFSCHCVAPNLASSRLLVLQRGTFKRGVLRFALHLSQPPPRRIRAPGLLSRNRRRSAPWAPH